MLVISLLLNQKFLLYPGICDFWLTDISLTLLCIIKGFFKFYISSAKYGFHHISMVDSLASSTTVLRSRSLSIALLFLSLYSSKIWREKIYNIIKKLSDSNGIKWLCTRMSYHRLPNLGELLQGDLVSNIRRNLASKDFPDRECNCNTNTKVKERCAYGGECRRCCVIYKVTCKFCGGFYVGNTQNTLKKKWNNTSRT